MKKKLRDKVITHRFMIDILRPCYDPFDRYNLPLHSTTLGDLFLDNRIPKDDKTWLVKRLYTLNVFPESWNVTLNLVAAGEIQNGFGGELPPCRSAEWVQAVTELLFSE